jgi:cell division septal protein FtsQ
MSPRAAAVRRGLPPASAVVSAPADKRFRRPDVRPGRRRRLGRLVTRVAVLTAIGAGGLVLVALAGRAVATSSLLAVRDVRVRGTVRLSESEVLTRLDGLRGQNILSVDLEAYRRRALDSPWVASATFFRTLPSTVELHIVERVPLALARISQRLFLVDRDGVIIDEFGPDYRAFDLPIADGLVPDEARAAAVVDAGRVGVLARFLDEIRPHAAIRRRLAQVDLATPRNLRVLFDHDPVWLQVGDRAFASRLFRYAEIAGSLRGRYPDMESVDLRFDERVFVVTAGAPRAVVAGR